MQPEPGSGALDRLRRALAELRERLDREAGGDRGRWLTALAPLAGRSSPIPHVPWPELLLMGAPKKLMLTAGLALLASLPFLLPRPASTPASVAEPELAAPLVRQERATDADAGERHVVSVAT